MTIPSYIILAIAAIPGIYYLLALYSSARFFLSWRRTPPNSDYTPPISCLKPIKGLDPDAYENYASFCRQDYPEYEILFCVDADDPALPMLEKLVQDFPERRIRLLFGSGRNAINDKIARLVRLVSEAQYDLLVITDGDIRVGLITCASMAAPFRDPKVGAATVPVRFHQRNHPRSGTAVGRDDLRFLCRDLCGLAIGRREVHLRTNHRHNAARISLLSAVTRRLRIVPPMIFAWAA